MANFIFGIIIGSACVFNWLNLTIGDHQEILAGIECVEQRE